MKDTRKRAITRACSRALCEYMKQININKVTFILAVAFGFYFGFLGIWNQDKAIGIPAFLFLGLLFTLEYVINRKEK